VTVKPPAATDKTATPTKPDSANLQLRLKPGESEGRALAELMLSGKADNAMNASNYAGRIFNNGFDINECMQVLSEQARAVNSGDLTHGETMLVSQAAALNAMFAACSHKAIQNMQAGYLPAAETFMRMSLRAQGQCRATWEAIATIKNPPIVYAKQANFANGHQQVNNGVPHAQAQEIQTQPTELLEHQHGEWMDTGATGAASSADPIMATVGGIHGAANSEGQGKRKDEPLSRRDPQSRAGPHANPSPVAGRKPGVTRSAVK
jgi:hypothetical protein